jgi:hypothetical protein
MPSEAVRDFIKSHKISVEIQKVGLARCCHGIRVGSRHADLRRGSDCWRDPRRNSGPRTGEKPKLLRSKFGQLKHVSVPECAGSTGRWVVNVLL